MKLAFSIGLYFLKKRSFVLVAVTVQLIGAFVFATHIV